MSVGKENTDLSLKYIARYNELKEQLFNESAEVLNRHRQSAFQNFVAQGIPTRKNENYKYTNLHPAFEHNYSHVLEPEVQKTDEQEIFRCDVPFLNTTLARVLNGWFVREENSYNFPEGVVLDSLHQVAQSTPQLLEKYGSIANPAEDALVALNTAFAKDGFFLYVPRNVQVEMPLQIINLLRAETDTFVTQRNFIYLEEGASVKVLLCEHTMDVNRYLTNSVTEVFVGNNAHFELYAVQNQHNNSTILNSVFVKQDRDSHATTHTVTLHGGLVRNNLKYSLDGENAESNMFGLAFVDRKQHVDNFTQVIHAKPHCLSNQIYKNVLDDQATGAFSGRIHVMRDAQKTNAFQRNNNLLLTDEASVQTKPQLIIDADDVKCSHGATVGQIDEEALFYLRARGIGEDRARLMLMNAFAHEVVGEIALEPLRERIDQLVERRLSGEVARCHECSYKCEC